ncbi:hypothetical protein OE88DRAFT_1372140 [Heliocybe sulcata]|uniref:Uncharacterized protein n=1 Tax=Heliocybe sulcata TaxID=5364 RepID=A0A5C3N493_9AGAM|nr:hypothetical protein OE88DRAFT_1372140 [Heliocybe sulcata]
MVVAHENDYSGREASASQTDANDDDFCCGLFKRPQETSGSLENDGSGNSNSTFDAQNREYKTSSRTERNQPSPTPGMKAQGQFKQISSMPRNSHDSHNAVHGGPGRDARRSLGSNGMRPASPNGDRTYSSAKTSLDLGSDTCAGSATRGSPEASEDHSTASLTPHVRGQKWPASKLYQEVEPNGAPADQEKIILVSGPAPAQR